MSNLPARLPNVLLIDCHDLGAVLGCYGWQGVDTPNLDRLARYGADRRVPEQFYGKPSSMWELYDLADDPWEKTNRAGDPGLSAVQAKLSITLDEHLHILGDQILNGPAENQVNQPDVPLWIREHQGTFKLRTYRPGESGEFTLKDMD